MTVDGEGTEYDSSPRTAALPGRCDIMVKEPFLHFPVFSPNSIPPTLQYKTPSSCSSPCRNKLTLHNIQVFIVPQS